MAKQRFLALLALFFLVHLAGAQTESAKKPVLIRVSSGVANGLKIHDEQPHYPREAREKGIQGDVILQARIDTKGNLTSLKPVEGDPILAAAAVDAVKHWRYRPYLLNGEPVEVETTIKIQFHM
jgi:periplasmic protein TonB